MNLLSRARSGLTVDRVSGPADLAVKFAAIVVAVGAVAVVFFGPKIEIRTNRQTLIDRGVVRRAYEKDGQPLPDAVAGVISTYNRANREDLELATNATSNQAPSTQLCRDSQALVQGVFPGTDCKANEPIVGRNHFWERLLIRRVDDQETLNLEAKIALAKTAVERIYDAQYLGVRTLVSNTGHTRAVNVNVRVPNGFSPMTSSQSISPFTLGPDDAPVERLYRSTSGIRESEVSRPTAGPGGDVAAVDRFAVDWQRDENAQGSVVLWVGILFFVIWVAIVFNDSRLRAQRRDAETEASATS